MSQNEKRMKANVHGYTCLNGSVLNLDLYDLNTCTCISFQSMLSKLDVLEQNL